MEFVYDPTNAYIRKAVSMTALGDYRAGVELYDKSIKISGHLVQKEGRREWEIEFTKTYKNRPNALTALGKRR